MKLVRDTINILVLLAVLMQGSVAVLAEDASSVEGADTIPQSSMPQPNLTPLQGGISKTERIKNRSLEDSQEPKSGNMNGWLVKMFASSGVLPQRAARLNGQANLQTLLSGLRQSQMSSEDYRKLEYGVLGLVAQKWVGGTSCTVIQVIPDCPAALAGIRPGDVILQANQHEFSKDDDQRVYWQTIAGKAGTAVDIVIKRDSEPITFHLVRMNIEDIKNDNIRRLFEMKLSLLGPPSAGESP